MKKITSDESNYSFNPKGIVTDSDGNVYAGIEAGGNLTIDSIYIGSGPRSYLIKFDSTGIYSWYKFFISNDTYSDVYMQDIGIDRNNNILFPGYFLDELYIGGEDSTIHGIEYITSFVMRFDSNGEIVNYLLLMDSASILDFDTDSENNLLILARSFGEINIFNGDTLIGNTLVAKYDDQNNLLWYLDQNVLSYNSNDDSFFYTQMKLVTDNDDNFFINYVVSDTMRLNGNFYQPDSIIYYYVDSTWIFDSLVYTYDTSIVYIKEGTLVKYNSLGMEQWHQIITAPYGAYFKNIAINASNEIITSIGASTFHNIYLSDSLIFEPTESPDFSNGVYLLKMNTDGDLLFTNQNLNNIYLENTFVFNQETLFSPGRTSTKTGYYAASITEIDDNLNFGITTEATCNTGTLTGPNSYVDFITFFDSTMYMYGHVDECAEIGDIEVYGKNNEEILFIAKLFPHYSSPYVIPDSLIYFSSESYVYPIPSNKILYLSMQDSTAQIQTIQVYNTMGQLFQIAFEKININTIQLNIGDLHPGFYFLVLMIENQQRTYKFLVN
ncbi:MAG: T9SS type A sorting domain-containing protein [Bacteroidetes bacterium]|nr:T9SS type A sorting domain-containing protein [Bacteroidota bacterium]MBP7400677.1 T9SS type A sorting domain-containing protein [Chitinophagales bacterium]MBK8680323.1 T9SS type A sorting domain-containing protein [Bacteroidota bacterium]MBP8755241.1 T9SS type A sorting domain-containing protein [Chitinophagales bacterium]MBP9190432.1 T9SS type A sorting domain-containing protein [Chitinophagales bacterium]